MLADSPCGDCPHKGCGKKHDTCRFYQMYRKKHEDEYLKNWLRREEEALERMRSGKRRLF